MYGEKSSWLLLQFIQNKQNESAHARTVGILTCTAAANLVSNILQSHITQLFDVLLMWVRNRTLTWNDVVYLRWITLIWGVSFWLIVRLCNWSLVCLHWCFRRFPLCFKLVISFNINWRLKKKRFVSDCEKWPLKMSNNRKSTTNKSFVGFLLLDSDKQERTDRKVFFGWEVKTCTNSCFAKFENRF